MGRIEKVGGWVYKNFISGSVYGGGKATRYNYLRQVAFKLLPLRFHSVKLHLNAVCNLSCKTCYSKRTGEALSKAEIFSFLDQLKRGKLRNRNIRLDLLGGEPLLRNDFLEIVSYAKTVAKVKSIQVFTNATLITDGLAREMRKAGVDVVIATLHSDREEVHDSITRSPGSWRKTVSGISSSLRAGIATYSFTVLASYNYDHLGDVEACARAIGAKTIYFPYIQQCEGDELCVGDKRKLGEAVKWTMEKNAVRKKRLFENLRARRKVCVAFVNTICVRANGAVTPCTFVDLEIGNIRNGKFYDILEKAYLDQELIDFLSIPEACRGCDIGAVCGGGCKAFRTNRYRDMKSKDGNCSGPFATKIPYEELGSYIPYFF